MNRRALCLAILLAASPAWADDEGRGLSLMERGAQLFFEGLLREVEPALDELEGLAQELEPSLRDFAQQMGPALRGLMDEVQDWSRYHPPEILPNGDIIIRRREPGGAEPRDATPQAEIEL